MTSQLKSGSVVLVVAVAATMAACGGGSGPAAVAAPPVASLALGLSDTFVGVLAGDGTGIWSGDGGGTGSGDADGGGGAGDGEFVKVKINFPSTAAPTGTVKWTVLRSQYGITDSTGTMSIQKDATAVGGYKVTAVNGVASGVRPTQSNFFVSASGQFSGSLPLPIGVGGSIKDSLFNGVRFADAKSSVTDMSEYAGTYVTTMLDANVGTGAGADVGAAFLKLNANGTARVCNARNEGTRYSDTCAGGLDMVVSFDDPANRNLLRLIAAPTQSIPLPAGSSTTLNMLAVVRKFGAEGVSMTADYVIGGVGINSRTGAMYGARMGSSPLNISQLVGAWSSTSRNVQGFGSGYNQVGIKFVNGVLKVAGSTSTGCDAQFATLTAGPLNGMTTATGSGGAMYLIALDADLAVSFRPGYELGLLRRYSVDPAVAPCQPL